MYSGRAGVCAQHNSTAQHSSSSSSRGVFVSPSCLPGCLHASMPLFNAPRVSSRPLEMSIRVCVYTYTHHIKNACGVTTMHAHVYVAMTRMALNSLTRAGRCFVRIGSLTSAPSIHPSSPHVCVCVVWMSVCVALCQLHVCIVSCRHRGGPSWPP